MWIAKKVSCNKYHKAIINLCFCLWPFHFTPIFVSKVILVGYLGHILFVTNYTRAKLRAKGNVLMFQSFYICFYAELEKSYKYLLVYVWPKLQFGQHPFLLLYLNHRVRCITFCFGRKFNFVRPTFESNEIPFVPFAYSNVVTSYWIFRSKIELRILEKSYC